MLSRSKVFLFAVVVGIASVFSSSRAAPLRLSLRLRFLLDRAVASFFRSALTKASTCRTNCECPRKSEQCVCLNSLESAKRR